MEKEIKNKLWKNKKKRNIKDKPLKIIPLGGLGEIGKNMMVIEYHNEMVVIDCGIMFPDFEHLGVDLILPDYNYIKANKEKIKAILITHGHEDHIGGLPFFYKEFNHIPLYAPRLAMELIKSKLDEAKIKPAEENLLRVVQPREKYKLSPHFYAEFIRVNHSIPDSFAIALDTPYGVVLHTGDFKIDYQPLDNNYFDFYRFADLGEKGVLLLMSDSTNIERKQNDITEKEVGVSLSRLIEAAKGRVIVASFASNIFRIGQLAKIAAQCGRKVITFGRNMDNNFEIARRLGYINIPDDTIMSSKDLKNYPDNKQLIITTGSQGEPMSALSLISQGIHKSIKVRPDDTIIISASVIPGNEKTVSKIINSLFLMGAQVFYEGTEIVHVSGHATRDNLQMMLRMVKPRYFMPIHGEARHLIHHADMAIQMGYSEQNVILAKDGDLVQITEEKAEIIDHILLDTVFVDGNIVGDVKKLIKERKTMSQDGVVIAIAGVRILEDKIECIPDVISKGFLFGDEMQAALDEIKEIMNTVIVEQIHKNGLDYNAINNILKRSIEKYIQMNFSKYPMIVTRIVEIEG